jgi:hypothetical protein
MFDETSNKSGETAGKSEEKSDALDEIIEDALKNERMRRPSIGFQRRVQQKIAIASEIRRDRRRMRFMMFFGFTVFTLAFGTSTLYFYLSGIWNLLLVSIPNVLSKMDLFNVFINPYWLVGALGGGVFCTISASILYLYWSHTQKDSGKLDHFDLSD